MKVYVTRHGTTELNKQKKVNGEIDEALAPEGIKQAKALIPDIPKSITHIYSSSMLRAKQTAEIISSALHIPLSFHDELSEIRMGSLKGKSWEEMEGGLDLKKKHRTVQFDYRPYDGESVEDVTKRLSSFLKKVNGKYNDNECLLITHGGIIRVLDFLEKGSAAYDTQKHVSLLTFDLDKIVKTRRGLLLRIMR